jgi:23S rRNA (uracil1939-C5)-methyltransferase
MRARFHVADGRVGFYREGTHTLCDPASTGQLSDESLAAVHRVVEMLDAAGAKTSSVELSENIAASERALSITVDQCSPKVRRELPQIVEAGSARGVVVRDIRGQRAVAGHPSVADPLGVLTAGRVTTGSLARRPESFFQANRFLVPSLVTAVLDEVAGDRVIDLYAGVGLFSVALAATSPREIVAVEGDHASGADLRQNAGSCAASITLALQSVEDYLRESRFTPSTAIVDPPRTGISPEALDGLVRRGAGRIVYVSCDPATMARDAHKFVDAGYVVRSLRGFDLFPNTPHVESLGVFERETQ